MGARDGVASASDGESISGDSMDIKTSGDAWAARIAYVGFDEAAGALLREIKPVLIAALPEILERFYARTLALPELAPRFAGPDRVHFAKEALLMEQDRSLRR